MDRADDPCDFCNQKRPCSYRHVKTHPEKPPYLVRSCDQCFTGLDAQTKRAMERYFSRRREGNA
jgi:hypothetical protein